MVPIATSVETVLGLLPHPVYCNIAQDQYKYYIFFLIYHITRIVMEHVSIKTQKSFPIVGALPLWIHFIDSCELAIMKVPRIKKVN